VVVNFDEQVWSLSDERRHLLALGETERTCWAKLTRG
jgi:hypothetical protein